MAGASIFASFEHLDEMEGALTRIAAIGARPQPLLRIIGTAMATSTRDRIRRGVDPLGQPFAPLSKAYAEIKTGPSILIERGMSGGLMGSISVDHGGVAVDSTGVRWGSNKIYAAIHQFGGVIKPKNKKALHFMLAGGEAFARSVTIPARPYLGLSRDDRRVILELTDDFLRRAMRG